MSRIEIGNRLGKLLGDSLAAETCSVDWLRPNAQPEKAKP